MNDIALSPGTSRVNDLTLLPNAEDLKGAGTKSKPRCPILSSKIRLIALRV